MKHSRAGVRLLGRAPVRFRVLVLGVFALSLSACLSVDDSSSREQDLEITTIYLVRHAEKMSDSRDPDLTAEGHKRALNLAQVLDGLDVDALWTSDYARTRQTLKPLSTQRSLPVTVYDARDSGALVSSLLASTPGKTHVVAGHSNTIPQIVDLLEAWPQSPKTPRAHLGHDEYDRLYVVTVASGEATKVDERRY